MLQRKMKGKGKSLAFAIGNKTVLVEGDNHFNSPNLSRISPEGDLSRNISNDGQNETMEQDLGDNSILRNLDDDIDDNA